MQETEIKSQDKLVILALGLAAVLVGFTVGTQFFPGQSKPAVGTIPGATTPPYSVLHAADYHSLLFSTNDSNVIFFGHHNGIMRSEDSGKTWQTWVDKTNFDAMSLAFDPSDSRIMYLAGHDILQVSRDGGVNWSPMQNTLPGTDIHGFTVSPDKPDSLFAFIYKKGFFHSNDAGLTWEHLSTQLPVDVTSVASSGGTPETLYAAGMNEGVFKSADGGHSWSLTGKGLGSGLMTIAVDAKTPNTVYAGGGGGLYKSTDGGRSWTKLTFPRSNVAALAISPTQPDILMAIAVTLGDGEVYRSQDGGLTWGG